MCIGGLYKGGGGVCDQQRVPAVTFLSIKNGTESRAREARPPERALEGGGHAAA